MKTVFFLMLFAFLGLAVTAQQSEPIINYNEDVFVVQVEDTSGAVHHYLQIGQNHAGVNPTSKSDLPGSVQPYINSLSVFIDAVSKVNNVRFNTINADGLMDNYGNIYLPISDFD